MIPKVGGRGLAPPNPVLVQIPSTTGRPRAAPDAAQKQWQPRASPCAVGRGSYLLTRHLPGPLLHRASALLDVLAAQQRNLLLAILPHQRVAALATGSRVRAACITGPRPGPPTTRARRDSCTCPGCVALSNPPRAVVGWAQRSARLRAGTSPGSTEAAVIEPSGAERRHQGPHSRK